MNDNSEILYDNIVPRKFDTENNGKKIYLRDEQQIISNSLIKGIIKSSKNKLLLIIIIIFSITFFALYKAFMYSIKDLNITKINQDLKQNRGLIVDRQDNIISASIPAKDLYFDPRKFINPETSISKLKKIFPGRDFSDFKTIKNYRLIKKYISRSEEIEIKKIGEPGLVIEKTSRRVYPQNNLFSHITGFLSKHGEAQSKVEKNFDDYLSKGHDLKLTLDLKVQNILHEELYKGMKEFRSKSAAGVIIDVNNGEILSLVSLPDYNPNYPGMIQPYTENNLITAARYEMGSTLKTFTVAAAIHSDIDVNATFFDIAEPYYIAKNKIKDLVKFDIPQNISQIFINSSNIGSIKLFEYTGLQNQKNFYELVGLRETLKVKGLRSINNKFPISWDENSGKSLSFGYGASITPISLVRSFSTLVNGGYKINPTIIKTKDQSKTKILNGELSDKLNKLLFDVVELGTGEKAKVQKIQIGGKTGTARKIKNGIYSKDVITSFVGVFPIPKPKYLVFILFDEPRSENSNHNFYGGNTAAPIFSKVVSRIYPILDSSQMLKNNPYLGN